MTAGRGIIHSEMPQQTAGRMRGFQLWLNLPAAEKMKPAGYRDIPAAAIPAIDLPTGGRVKVIAGELIVDGHVTPGPVQGVTTEPIYLDIELPAGAGFAHPVPPGHTAFIYVFEGAVSTAGRELSKGHAAVLADGDRVALEAGPAGGRALLLAGKPLREPVVQYGPFVMNTRDEIEQALRDYSSGRLAEPRR
jgi:redox-sensitive bicupin YhaK (pirin superfamily)